MEDLIKQAFLHVDVIGPHVQEGHYDLIGPNGEIILPVVWDKVIEPGWAITMIMWPLDKTPSVNNFLKSPSRPKLTPFGPSQGSRSSKSKKGKEVRRKSDNNGPRSPNSRLENGSDGDAENSDAENNNKIKSRSPTSHLNRGSKGDTKNRGAEDGDATNKTAINAALQELNDIDDEFRTKWLPYCLEYINEPPKDPKKREYEYRKRSETILQKVVLKLDDVETNGIDEIRQRRKELIRQAHEIFDRLDAAKASSETKGGDTTGLSKREEIRHREESARHACPYPDCGESFSTKTHLQRHTNERHEKRKWFHCPVTDCDYSVAGGKTFLRKDNWKRHMIEIHNIDEQALPEPLEVNLVVNKS